MALLPSVLAYSFNLTLLWRPLNNEYDTRCDRCPKGAASLYITSEDEVPIIVEFNEKKVVYYTTLYRDENSSVVLPMSGYQGHKEEDFTGEFEPEEVSMERVMIKYLLEAVTYGVQWETFQDDLETYDVEGRILVETEGLPFLRKLLLKWLAVMAHGSAS